MIEKYYVAGCVDNGLGVDQVEDQDAEFWTLYARGASGESEALADFADRRSAEAVMAIYVERDALQASQDHEDNCLIDALASRDECRLRAVTAEDELARRDAAAAEPFGWLRVMSGRAFQIMEGAKRSPDRSGECVGPWFAVYTSAQPAALEQDVTNILTLLSEQEWAEHCTKSTIGQRLESAITELHNEIADAKSLSCQPASLEDAPGKVYQIRKLDGSEEWQQWCEVSATEYYGSVSNDGWGRRILHGAPANVPDEWLIIPAKPSQEHLNSIAMRYRHDFYLLPDNQRDSALSTARQMYEECSGQGFYSIPKPE